MTYCFSIKELKTLLKGCGYDSVAGLNVETIKVNDNDVLIALNKLTNLDIVANDNNSFVVSKDVRTIIDVIGTKRDFFALHTHINKLSDLCIYVFDNKLLICSSKYKDSTHISFEVLGFDDFIAKLIEEGYFDFKVNDIAIDEKEIIRYEKEIFQFIDPNEPLEFLSGVLFSIEHKSSSGKSYGYIRIIEYYLYNYISCKIGESIIRDTYSESNFYKLIKRLFYDDNC